jgi:L-ascorbate 6-phosphate lactonase
MAEVKLTGQALIEDINSARPDDGTVAFWWMGQGSFIYKGSSVIYFDPYLTPSPARQTPPVLKYGEVTNADLVLCTHDHLDHIDPDTLPPVMVASPRATLVVPKAHVRRVADLGIPEGRIVGINHMETVELDGVRVTAIKSKHESFDEVEGLGFPFLGYVVETNGTSFYHSGDTVPYEGLVTYLQDMMPDAVFLPINGRDAERYRRNCLGNMTFQEAVDIAGEVKPAWAIPHHYDMFRGNQEDPQKFVEFLSAKYPEIKTWVGPAGERVVIGR